MSIGNRIALDDAVALCARGKRLFIPGTSGEPRGLIEAIAGRPGCLAGVSVIVGYVSGLNDFSGLAGSGGRLIGFFPASKGSGLSIEMLQESYFGADRRIAALRPDVVVTEVAPPRSDGTCSIGIAADYLATALASATVRIAIINPALPDLPHAPQIALTSFTHHVQHESGLLTVDDPGSDPVSSQIAANVAELVVDGATIQLGIGRIPGQISKALVNKHGLRFHSGIVTSGIRTLAEAGALADDQSVVAASYGGDAAFYAWLAGRRDMRLAPVTFTHAPATLAAIPGMISINSALEIDVLGQVNAEWIGQRRISARGGLPDFAHAAQRSPGGIAIVALPATDGAGRQSRIVRRLKVPPTIAAGGIDVFVTEHGVADLRGRTAKEREQAIMAIAAPAFQDMLRSDSAVNDG